MFNEYPYTDFHEMNTDWVISKIKNVETAEANTKQYAEDADAAKIAAQDARDIAIQAKDDAVEAKDDAESARDAAESFVQNTADQLNLLQSRVDNIIPDGTQTAGNTELLDIRVAYDSTTYTSAGDAVRAQAGTNNNNIVFVDGKLISLQTENAQEITLSSYNVITQGFIRNDGTVTSSASHRLCKFTDPTVSTVIIPQMTNAMTTFPTVVVENAGTVTGYWKGSNTQDTVIDLSSITYDEIYVNWWSGESPSQYFDYVGFTYYTPVQQDIDEINASLAVVEKSLNNVTDTFALSALDDYAVGKYFTIVSDAIVENNSPSNKIVTMPAYGISEINFTLTTSLGTTMPFAAVLDDNNDIIASVSGKTAGDYKLSLTPVYSGKVIINFFDYAASPNPYYDSMYVKYVDVAKAYEQEIRDIAGARPYKTIVRKPFAFSGAVGAFAGDSITYGYTSGNTDVHGTGDYPTLFCNAVGMTCHNISRPGALICPGYNAITTVCDQVKQISFPYDYLFIAGGTNDYMLGATLAEVETNVADLCTWLNTNVPTAKVIWITPIDNAETVRPILATDSLQAYRDTITRTVIENDDNARFSVIQGTDMNFPDKYDDAAYIAAMYGDLLHPSALAYKALYTPALLNDLC